MIGDDLLLRIRIRVVTNEAVVEVGIGALENADVRTENFGSKPMRTSVGFEGGVLSPG